MATHETLRDLADKVGQLTSVVASYLEANGLPQPSFAPDGPDQYPEVPEVTAPRMALVQSLSDMLHLALGGKDYIFMESMTMPHDLSVFDVLSRFDFWGAVPLGGSASYADVAAHTGLPEELVRRFLRHAMTMRLFAEERQEIIEGEEKEASVVRVMHTPTTAFVARNPGHRSWIDMHLQDTHPACLRLPEALQMYSHGRSHPAQELHETAFTVAFGRRVRAADEEGKASGDDNDDEKTLGFWDFLEQDGEGEMKGYRMRRFAKAMSVGRHSSGVDFDGLLKAGFDWESLGEGTIVDVGGSSGHDAVLLARAYPRLSIVVEDLPPIEAAFQAALPEDLVPKISFRPHDFFAPQPITADVYFFKAILHNWSDRHAVRILAALVPALRPGARLVLCEGVFPPSSGGSQQPAWQTLPLSEQRILSAMDLQMLNFFNARQRTSDDWRGLLAEADARFRLDTVYVLPGSAWGVLNVVFQG